MSPTVKRVVAGTALGVALLSWAFVLKSQSGNSPLLAHLRAGEEAATRGRSGQAEQEWLAASVAAPTDPRPWELLGELYLSSEQWPKAVGAFKKLAELAPNTPGVHSKLAVCTLRTGEEMTAFERAKDALKVNPDDFSALAISAFVNGYLGKDAEQLDALRHMRKLRPDDPDVLEMSAEALSGQKKYDEILPVLDRLIALKPDQPMAYGLRGMIHIEQATDDSGLKLAEADLNKALQLAPLYGFARYQLGRTYLRLKRYPEAIVQLEQAEKLSPRKMDIPFELANAYARANQADKADQARARFQVLRDSANRLNALLKQCSLEPNNFAAHLETGKITLAQGDFRKARYYLLTARKLKPQDKDAEAAVKDFTVKLQAKMSAQGAPNTGIASSPLSLPPATGSAAATSDSPASGTTK